MVAGTRDEGPQVVQTGAGKEAPFEPLPGVHKKLVRIARWCGLSVAIVGGGVLAGWIFDLPAAKSVLPGLATMKANTAFCFLLIGSALFSSTAPLPRAGPLGVLPRALALMAATVGVLTLLEYLSGINIGIDQLLFQDLANRAAAYPGRMSPLTALTFVLLGTAVCFLDQGSGKGLSFVHTLALSAAAIAVVSSVGYLYSALAFYQIASYTSMALHTSLAFVVASVGVLVARPDRGVVPLIFSPGSGGIMARRLVPVSFLAPIALGWIRLKGQRAGLFGTEVGVGLLVISMIVILTAVFFLTAEELNRADERRNVAERQYRELVERAPIGIYRSTREGRYLAVNAACARLLGYDSTEELLRVQISDAVYFDPAERLAVMAEVERRGGNAGFDLRLKRRDGTPVWTHLEGRAVTGEDGVTEFYEGFALNIQEQKRAEEALRQSEERFHRSFSLSPVGMGLTETSSGRFLDVNEQLASTLGYERQELIGRTTLDLGLWADPLARRRMIDDLEANRPVRNIDVVLRTKAGETRYMLMSVESLQLGEERIHLSVLQDLTERKLLEEQFRQAQKMEAVGQLAGGVAHDFNNLLTAILGYADLATSADSPDSLSESIAEIREAAQRAASLTRQLLAFSRRQMLEPKVLEVNALIKNLYNMLSRLIGEHVSLRLALVADVGRIRADAGQVEQVIMNLVVNARDAMPQGGKLTIETANVELSETYSQRHAQVQPGSHVMVSVSDTGVGMDAATQARLFEPFFTTKEEGKGTGLGLATVYGIVKQSGGSIWVYSEPGKGTTFKVYFPRVEAPAATDVPSPVYGSLHGTETILLVEDESSVRRLARRILEARGYRVLEAGNGADALALAASTPDTIHLLLTDLVMPDFPGTTLAERLALIRPEVRVLFMSGYTDDTVVRDGLIDRGRLFLQKPFTPETLARKVREALSES